MGILDFLFGRDKTNDGRDGRTPETAIIVKSVEQEYRWMQKHYRGYQPQSQALQEIDGEFFDVLKWINGTGDEVTIYFDISAFYGKL